MRCLTLALLLILSAHVAWAQCSFSNPTACGSPGMNNLAVGGNQTIGGTLGVSGTTTLSGGGTLSGTWAGPTTFSNVVTFSGGVGGTMAANILEMNSINTYGNTITLSGLTVPTYLGNYIANWAGSSTRTDNTSISAVHIGTSSDHSDFSASGGTRNELLVSSNYGGGAFDGFRQGIMVQMNFNSASTLSKSANGGSGFNTKVVPSANFGGVTTGYGVSQFGVGAFFGGNPWGDCATGATFLSQCVGLEVDGALQSGASASNFTVQQDVVTSDHATHGRNSDDGFAIVAQAGASAGLRNIFVVGSYNAQWPGDQWGYIGAIESSQNGVAVQSAGGWDLNQLTVSASGCGNADTDGFIKCPVGGGFYWRNPGVQLLASAEQVAYASIGSDNAGSVVDSTYSQMSATSGSITVGSGGSNFTTGDVVCDIYGDCAMVNASAGSVTGVSSVLSSGWQVSPPGNPVTFTAMSHVGTTLGSGLTLNLAWTAKHQVRIGGSSTDTVLGSGANLGSLSATIGFAHLPFTNSTSGSGGIPTGTPTNTNGPACVWNDVTFVLDCYSPSAGAWKHIAFTNGAG